MDVEEVTKLFASLSLTDKDGPVVKLDTHMEEIQEPKVAPSLVGKIFANELINRYVFKRNIPKIWRTTQEFEVEWIRENIFAFHFTNQMDRKRVIARGPWSFDNFLLALEEPKGLSDSDIAKMQFNCVEFWIQIHKAPLMCMNKQTVIFLGKQIGVLKAIDLGESGHCWGEYLQVRVGIDANKPLRRVLRVDLGGSEKEVVVMLLRYERLPKYCFHCGMLGHEHIECPEEDSINRGKDYNDTYKFGSWLRASSIPKWKEKASTVMLI
ncbi:hypothetical protein EZV62_016197 [Acer yangbiense]|uniref:CCHC-type domain-containing protein n=1 Tax=Acer yangbiense TaxID=1000413 RepID=A0A5C7HNL0_9ROSI|nr:hypothetical protein EZV62_016197 [Acer yangbiense]